MLFKKECQVPFYVTLSVLLAIMFMICFTVVFGPAPSNCKDTDNNLQHVPSR